jgi:orotate phosphoribosyltransferase
MNFRSIAQLSSQLLHWSRGLPPVDVVAGIPRSGLLAANILGLYLNAPVTDIDGLLASRCFSSGRRGRTRGSQAGGTSADADLLSTPRTVLILDDSLGTGQSMRTVKERILAAALPHRILYGAVYIIAEQIDKVDHYCEILSSPRVFEWNVLHHPLLANSCVDMDGVLCRDPTEDANDDGPAYGAFLQSARPHLIPTTKIGWIVTSRLERYRHQTEEWLDKFGIAYDNLVMLDYPSGEWRQRLGIHSAFKAEVYASTNCQIFIESSLKQAIEIAHVSRRHVICTDTMQLIHPGSAPLERHSGMRDLHASPSISGSAASLAKAIARTVTPRRWHPRLRKRFLNPNDGRGYA